MAKGEEGSLAVLGLQGGSFRVLLPFSSQYLSWKLVLINNELDYVRIKLRKNSNLLGPVLPLSLDDLQLKKGCWGSSLHSWGLRGVQVFLFLPGSELSHALWVAGPRSSF